MRAIEAKINELRGEGDRRSDIPLTNFRGIELRHFSCEIARLALIIAEYQCDVLYRGPKLALLEFLPLKDDNWITCGNALRLDWLSLWDADSQGVRVQREDLDLWGETRDQAEIEFENEGGETYICGNPPYLGSRWQSDEQKSDLKSIFGDRTSSWKSLDYVSGWFMKAADYGTWTKSAAAFVSTNSICQGLQVPILWQLIFSTGQEINFAHTSFKWSNLASHNAGVTVVIVGISNRTSRVRRLFSLDDAGMVVVKDSENINAYLSSAPTLFVEPLRSKPDDRSEMLFGNMPRDGGFLCLEEEEKEGFIRDDNRTKSFFKRYLGSQEMIQGKLRYCLWIHDDQVDAAIEVPMIASRLQKVAEERFKSSAQSTRKYSKKPHRFVQIQGVATNSTIAVAGVSSEKREFLPVDLLDSQTILSNLLFALYDAPLWNMALIASRIHLVWIATVCGKLKTDFRYSNTLGWNTFPVPTLTDRNKADLTRCAEDILLAREQYFPATIADMYDRDRMDTEFPLVREAHDRNDEALERIYIGRRFKNDTERLEKLFELYTKMTTPQALPKKSAKGKIHP